MVFGYVFLKKRYNIFQIVCPLLCPSLSLADLIAGVLGLRYRCLCRCCYRNSLATKCWLCERPRDARTIRHGNHFPSLLVSDDRDPRNATGANLSEIRPSLAGRTILYGQRGIEIHRCVNLIDSLSESPGDPSVCSILALDTQGTKGSQRVDSGDEANVSGVRAVVCAIGRQSRDPTLLCCRCQPAHFCKTLVRPVHVLTHTCLSVFRPCLQIWC